MEESPEPKKDGKDTTKYIGIGIALGVAFGVALDNIGLGIALGLVLGAAWGQRSKSKGDD